MSRIADVYELSPMQQGMLFHALYAPDSAAYINQFGCRLSGRLNPELLRQAWQVLVDRHAVLRTSFHWEKLEKPMQVVRQQAAVPWTFSDWRGAPPEKQQQLWQEHLRNDLKTGFQLGRAPLMRCRLAQVEEHEYLFNWSLHHLLMDGWCLSLVLDELFQIYAGLSHGTPPELKPVRPYRDYILWLQDRDRARTQEFWSRYLEGFRAPTALPMISGGAHGPAGANSCLAVKLPRNLSGRLRECAGRHQVTASTMVEGAWAMLLARYSGERDVVFGATVSGRPPELSGVESMIGLFINTVPVRVQVDPTMPLVPWLQAIQARQAERSPHEHAGLMEIQQWSEVPRGQPLFQSNVIFMNYPFRESLAQGSNGLRIGDVSIFDRDDTPLTLQVTPGAEWQIELLYDAGRFEQATVERMLGHVQKLLTEFVEDPSRPVSAFPILTDPEAATVPGFQ